MSTSTSRNHGDGNEGESQRQEKGSSLEHFEDKKIGEIFKPGEYVVFSSPVTYEDTSIGQVENVQGDNTSSTRMKVRRFFRLQDLSQKPPKQSIQDEIYYSDCIETEVPLSAVLGRCQVLSKTEFSRLKSLGRELGEKSMVFMCDQAYSSKDGTFSPLGTDTNLISTKTPSVMAKELGQVLLEIERRACSLNLPETWRETGGTWRSTCERVSTVRECSQSLLELEEGLQIKYKEDMIGGKDRTAWRKCLVGLHTYDSLCRYIQSFGAEVNKYTSRAHSLEDNRKASDSNAVPISSLQIKVNEDILEAETEEGRNVKQDSKNPNSEDKGSSLQPCGRVLRSFAGLGKAAPKAGGDPKTSIRHVSEQSCQAGSGIEPPSNIDKQSGEKPMLNVADPSSHKLRARVKESPTMAPPQKPSKVSPLKREHESELSLDNSAEASGDEEDDSLEDGNSSGKNKSTQVRLLKLPREMRGRWSSERYRSAQLKLVGIMKEQGASLGQPILRPTLREEARKHIGDTGLLDHLLKHMTDMVVTPTDRFRRRHNNAGQMEYWLEDRDLVEARKAAGVTDPSWIPPPGWVPGASFTFMPSGMTREEVARFEELSKTVASFQRVVEELKESEGRLKPTEVASSAVSKVESLEAQVNSLQRELQHHSKSQKSDIVELRGKLRAVQNQLQFVEGEMQEMEQNEKKRAKHSGDLEDKMLARVEAMELQFTTTCEKLREVKTILTEQRLILANDIARVSNQQFADQSEADMRFRSFVEEVQGFLEALCMERSRLDMDVLHLINDVKALKEGRKSSPVALHTSFLSPHQTGGQQFRGGPPNVSKGFFQQ